MVLCLLKHKRVLALKLAKQRSCVEECRSKSNRALSQNKTLTYVKALNNIPASHAPAQVVDPRHSW